MATPHIVLTCSISILYEAVKAAFIHSKVRPYIPNPRRRFKCQKYGIGSNTCRGKLTCAKCVADEHSTERCTATRRECPNCHRPYVAFSRTCQIFKKEKQVFQLKVTEKITLSQAHKKLSPRSRTSHGHSAPGNRAASSHGGHAIQLC